VAMAICGKKPGFKGKIRSQGIVNEDRALAVVLVQGKIVLELSKVPLYE